MPRSKTTKKKRTNLLDRVPYRSILVWWCDAAEPMDNAEVERHELPEPQTIISVGLLVQETDDHIVLAGAWKPEQETFDYTIAILKVAIVKRCNL